MSDEVFFEELADKLQESVQDTKSFLTNHEPEELIPVVRQALLKDVSEDVLQSKGQEALDVLFADEMPNVEDVESKHGKDSEYAKEYGDALDAVESGNPDAYDALVFSHTASTNGNFLRRLTANLNLLANQSEWNEYWERHKIPKKSPRDASIKHLQSRPLDIMRRDHVKVVCENRKPKFQQLHANGKWYRVRKQDIPQIVLSPKLNLQIEDCKNKNLKPWTDVPRTFWTSLDAVWIARAFLALFDTSSVRAFMRQEKNVDKLDKFLMRMVNLHLKAIYCTEHDCVQLAKDIQEVNDTAKRLAFEKQQQQKERKELEKRQKQAEREQAAEERARVIQERKQDKEDRVRERKREKEKRDKERQREKDERERVKKVREREKQERAEERQRSKSQKSKSQKSKSQRSKSQRSKSQRSKSQRSKSKSQKARKQSKRTSTSKKSKHSKPKSAKRTKSAKKPSKRNAVRSKTSKKRGKRPSKK